METYTPLQRIYYGFDSGMLLVFDLRRGEIASKIQAHEASVRKVFVVNHKVITISDSSEIKTWNANTLEQIGDDFQANHGADKSALGTVVGIQTATLNSACLAGPNHVITGGMDGQLIMHRV